MSKQLTDAKRRSIQKYDSANTKQIHLKLNLNTDADLLNFLSHIDNVQGYIKALINRDRKLSPDLDKECEAFTGVSVPRW